MLEQVREPLAQRSRYRLLCSPEEAVMDDYQVGPSRDSRFEGVVTAVHSQDHLVDLVLALDLQSVERAVVEAPDVEIVVEPCDQFRCLHAVQRTACTQTRAVRIAATMNWG